MSRLEKDEATRSRLTAAVDLFQSLEQLHRSRVSRVGASRTFGASMIGPGYGMSGSVVNQLRGDESTSYRPPAIPEDREEADDHVDSHEWRQSNYPTHQTSSADRGSGLTAPSHESPVEDPDVRAPPPELLVFHSDSHPDDPPRPHAVFDPLSDSTALRSGTPPPFTAQEPPFTAQVSQQEPPFTSDPPPE